MRRLEGQRTICRSGGSTNPDAARAARESVERALGAFEGRAPCLAFVFASPRHELSSVLKAAAEVAPGMDVVGCTTAGELTERGLSRHGVSVLLVRWADAQHELAPAVRMGLDSFALYRQLCTGFRRMSAEHATEGRSSSVSIVLGDGLSTTLEQLVVQMRKLMRPGHQIVGAGAADDGIFERTSVGLSARALAAAALAVHVFSARAWGVGVAHGMKRSGSPMHVTGVRGNVVYELDGTVALEVYRAHALERGVLLDERTRRQFLRENQLGVLLFDDVVRVCAPIGFETDGGVRFAGEIPEGSSVCFMHAEPEQLRLAAGRAAAQAQRGLFGARAAGLLVFSGSSSGALPDSRHEAALAEICRVFPGVPLAGFLSYGEIAQTETKLDGYHNRSIVTVAIPE